MACAPPMAYTSSMPSSAAAARMVGCGRPPKSFCGGDARAMDSHAGGQRRNHVHDDRRRVDGQAAGNVEAHPGHRNPVLADDGAVAEFDVDVAGALAVGEAPGTADGFLQGRPHGRVQAVQGGLQRLCRAPAGGPAPRRRSGVANSVSAAKPRCRTAEMMSRTFCSASATVWCRARGTAARSPARVRRRPRRSTVRKSTAAEVGRTELSGEVVTGSFYAPRTACR